MEYTKGEWEYKEGEYNHHDDKKWCNTGSIKRWMVGLFVG